MTQLFAAVILEPFADVARINSTKMAQEFQNKFGIVDAMFTEKIIDYFKKVVIPHKIEVYKAGMQLLSDHTDKTELLLTKDGQTDFVNNLIVHDLSKFSVHEAFGYSGYNRSTGEGKEAFERAWHHHKMYNKHHPEYWLNPNRGGVMEPLAMPNIYALEMIADWIGAGKTYGSTLQEWLPGNIGKFLFANPHDIAAIITEITGIEVRVHNGRLTDQW